MWFYLKIIFLSFSEIGVHNLKCKLCLLNCHINPVIMYACYRRPKALQSLHVCFLLFIVMPCLNKISYLIFILSYLHCTDSSLLISVAVCGDHTVEAYSNCERTKVLYALDFRSLFWTRIFLLIKPCVWFAFIEVLFMCVLGSMV